MSVYRTYSPAGTRTVLYGASVHLILQVVYQQRNDNIIQSVVVTGSGLYSTDQSIDQSTDRTVHIIRDMINIKINIYNININK